MGGRDRTLSRPFHSFEEEGEPCFPVAGAANLVKHLVVDIAILFEVQAQIQERLAQHAGVAQQQRYEQPPHAPVAVEEGMNGLELHVRNPRP